MSEMSETFYFPRLQHDAARQLLADYSEKSIPILADRASVESEKSYWYPTAPSGQHATPEILKAFQSAMRDIAKEHGYPAVPTEKDRARVQFDRDVVPQILAVTPLLPAEASQEAVWSFLSLVVVPDVAFWRWPNSRQKDDYERILGYPRNVFRRLWWRAYTFGTAADSVGHLLLEDEAVAILERTSIGGNRVLARAIAEIHVRRFQAAGKRTDVLRDAMKRIRRLHGFVAFHCLTEHEVRTLVGDVFDQAQATVLPAR